MLESVVERDRAGMMGRLQRSGRAGPPAGSLVQERCGCYYWLLFLLQLACGTAHGLAGGST
jgi:hypothetical protein